MLTVVLGKRGSGKTTMMRAMIDAAKKPVLVPDVLGNYDPEKEPNNPNWCKVTSTEQMIARLKLYLTDENSPEVFVVQAPDMAKVVDFAASALREIQGGTLLLDEADFVSLAEAPALDDLVRYGRNFGIDFVAGCRRPAEISKNITAGSDRFLSFGTHEPRDVDYLSKVLGEELADEIPKLPRHHGVFIDYKAERMGIFKTDASGVITVLKSTPLDKTP